MKFSDLIFEKIYNIEMGFWHNETYMVRVIKNFGCNFYVEWYIIGGSQGGTVRLNTENEVEDFVNNLK